MFGGRLRKLRESKGMSQIELGKALGIGNVTLSQYEKETRNPDNETLIKIANFFDVSVDYLLGREKENSTTFSKDGAYTFSSRLKELRKNSGLLQKDMADKIGITKSAYGYYEQGKTIPDIVTAKKISDILNVSVDYLLVRETEEISVANKEIMARNINFYMNKNGTTRAELAAAIDVPYTTLSAWLQAKTYPRIDKIEKMASYFGIRKSDLVENDAELSRQSAFKEADAWRNDEMEELLELVAVLDDSDMEKIVDYLKLLIAAKGK